MINVNHLFPILHSNLIELLHALRPTDWNKPTLCKEWSVKDIVSHLLDGQIRRLSIGRDNYRSSAGAPPSAKALVQQLNALNHSWVESTRRISPEVLVSLHEFIGPQYVEYITGLDPNGAATFAVTWAGEQASLNWMDVARDYTEQWVHQQQIREALGKAYPHLLTEELYRPTLEIWMHALPFAYSTLSRPNGTAIEITITGAVGGSWHLVKLNDTWEFLPGWDLPSNTHIKVDHRNVWKVLSKNLRGEAARAVLRVTGDEELAQHFADIAAVVA